MLQTASYVLLGALICTALLGIGLVIGTWRERRKKQMAAIRGTITGWGASLRLGDKLILEHANGNRMLYVVKSVVYQRDVADVWRAEVEFKADIGKKLQPN